jgi:hypothetical protein
MPGWNFWRDINYLFSGLCGFPDSLRANPGLLPQLDHNVPFVTLSVCSFAVPTIEATRLKFSLCYNTNNEEGNARPGVSAGVNIKYKNHNLWIVIARNCCTATSVSKEPKTPSSWSIWLLICESNTDVRCRVPCRPDIFSWVIKAADASETTI